MWEKNKNKQKETKFGPFLKNNIEIDFRRAKYKYLQQRFWKFFSIGINNDKMGGSTTSTSAAADSSSSYIKHDLNINAGNGSSKVNRDTCNHIWCLYAALPWVSILVYPNPRSCLSFLLGLFSNQIVLFLFINVCIYILTFLALNDSCLHFISPLFSSIFFISIYFLVASQTLLANVHMHILSEAMYGLV